MHWTTGFPHHESLTKPVEVLTAVVDRLPSDTDRLVGEEGLAYLFAPAAPALAGHESAFDKAAQKPGSMKFLVPTPEYRPWQYTIQLPLAQTVFSTGKSSTLIHRTYDHVSEKGLVQTSSRFLGSKTVHLPFEEPHGAIAAMVPLIPLTAFRVVRNAMGNIIRLLSSATSTDDLQQSATWSDPQPASQELEAVVAAYFKDLNMSPEPVNVWALIAPKVKGSWSQQRNEGSATRTMRLWTPQEIRSLWTAEDAQKQRDRIVNSTTLRMLRAGGRLHRVLSGGGGWGKKAGLLSLDPDMVYSSRELRGEKGWDFNFEGEGAEAVEKQQRQALGEVVQEGESIMFFLAPRDTEQFEEGRKSAWNFVNRADRSAIFGAIPSTIDLVPDELTSDRGRTTDATIRHRPNLFGAYSEGGLALDVLINDQRLNNGEPRSAIHTQTKLDVPYSHFRITEAAGDAEAIAAQRTAHRTRGSDRKRYEGTPRRGESGRSNDVSTWGIDRRRDAPNVERIRHRSGSEVKKFTFGDSLDYSTDSTNGFNAVQKSATSEYAGE
ncbi:hypothetical protein LTR78_006691 [Recurvomyces mirabilis]|uniref:Uncharacterized protein n=1 Tax=Recurvomyces mirabilis TaxID=574656 RepID=A0AAE0WKL4_9PEZI|nr:hypothetical protein LTR78_006691 [Recurvomyces mirabilis]KAK5151420.1 hypothetical protein LTS14_009263 [Recurvomyces mirabilis]